MQKRSTTSKEIYEILIREKTERNGSLIPSRNEKRQVGIKWKHSWKNIRYAKGITATEKEFAWKCSQDMLPVGNRIRRANVEKKCKNIVGNFVCEEVPNLKHKLIECTAMVTEATKVKDILQQMSGKEVKDMVLLTFSFNHRNTKRNQLLVWFAIKSLYNLYLEQGDSKVYLLENLRKEIDWNLELGRKIGSKCEMNKLADEINPPPSPQ